jgi:hypothetical protein
MGGPAAGASSVAITTCGKPLGLLLPAEALFESAPMVLHRGHPDPVYWGTPGACLARYRQSAGSFRL